MLWSDIGLALTISLIVLMVVNGTILSMRLRRTAQLDVKDRIAASSIVYYLAGTVILFVSAQKGFVPHNFRPILLTT